MGALLVTATVQCCKANADTLVGAKRQVVAIRAGIILTSRHTQGIKKGLRPAAQVCCLLASPFFQ